MTQAFNLSLFANKLNSSGATDNTGLQNSSVTVTAGTGLSGGGSVALGSSVTLNVGTVAIANGGTGQTTAANAINALVPTQTSQSGKFLTTNGSVVSWGNGGTVTSVATGSGLSGGTITSSGTINLACPSLYTVGSYCFGYKGGAQLTPGSSYTGVQLFIAAGGSYGNAPGTWQFMGCGTSDASGGDAGYSLWCRVS
jgi:hypothetical protein